VQPLFDQLIETYHRRACPQTDLAGAPFNKIFLGIILEKPVKIRRCPATVKTSRDVISQVARRCRESSESSAEKEQSYHVSGAPLFFYGLVMMASRAILRSVAINKSTVACLKLK
jgi:hypothetical protein